MRRLVTWFLLVLVSVLPVVTLSAALLIVLPAPSYFLALASVAASEKSFVPGLTGLALALVALLALRRRPRLRWAVGLAGAAAFALSLVPPVTAIRLARAHGTRLDLARYFTSSFDHEVGRAPATFRYAAPGGRPLDLDVYPAAGASPAIPRRAVVVIHGGGWSAGNKGEGSRASAWLAAQGFHVFDVQYRLAPQGRWREATGDIKCAIGWIKQHARGRLGGLGVNVDPERVALLGRSAGGQLALLAAFAAHDATLPAACTDGDPSVDAVISFYGPTDLRWGYHHPANPRVYDTSDRLRGFLGGPPTGVGDPYDRASPTERVHRQAPPVLLIHGGKDQFVSPLHIPRLHARLAPLGVRTEILEIPYARHGFDLVHGGLGGQLAEAAVLRFLGAIDAAKTGRAARR